jgi:acyl carrier protein
MIAATDAPVRAELLDCLQATLALLADRHHGPGRHLALGAELRFAPESGAGGLPTVEPRLEDHLIAAQRWLGLRVTARWRVPGVPPPATLLAEHDAVYVVADAFHLPWVPYYTRQHMEHSFLVERHDGGVVVHDAYHNDTQWGQARPGTWELSATQLAKVLPNGADVVALAPAPTGDTLPVPRFLAPAAETTATYLHAYRKHPDRAEALERLTLETWLLARSRRLHAALREHVAGRATGDASEHLAQWGLLVEQTYLAHRRVQRGRPEPGGVVDRLAELLAADAVVFGEPDLRHRIAAEVADILGVAEAELLAGAAFPSFPTFSSFRLIEIVERMEDRLGVRFDPDELVPENLHHVDDLYRIAARPPEEPS